MECMTPRMNPKVNYGLWVIMMYQCRFIFGNKCTILVSDVDNGEGYAYMGAGVIWESSVASLNLITNLKLL